MTDTAALRQPPSLPVWPAIRDAGRALWRHRWVYFGQWFLWSVALLLFQFIVAMIVLLAIGPRLGTNLLTQDAIVLAAMAILLIAGATTIFINIQHAVVLGQKPSLGRGCRLSRSDRPVLIAVASYWLVAHLLPTTIGLFLNNSHDNSLGEFADSSATAELAIAQYWILVCATAPFISLAMPIALFEHHANPIREALRRTAGIRLRIFATTILPLLPLALLEVGLAADWYSLSAFSLSGWEFVFQVMRVFAQQLFHGGMSFAVITISSAVVAVVYLRLSPRLEPIHRVFD